MLNCAIFVPTDKLDDMDSYANAANSLVSDPPVTITAADMFTRAKAYSGAPTVLVYWAANWNSMPEACYAIMASAATEVTGLWLKTTDGSASQFNAAAAELDLVDWEEE